jgi:hypothetical protein
MHPLLVRYTYILVMIAGPAALLLLAAWDPQLRPPGFRWLITLLAAWKAAVILGKPGRYVFWGIAALFNPLIPVCLHNRLAWMLLDLLAAAAFFFAPLFTRNQSENGRSK